MIHKVFPSLTETASGSHPCCVVSVTYDRTQCFHDGNTDSNPVDTAAMLELRPSLLLGCIDEARAEIIKRGEQLREMSGKHTEELQAMRGALSGLKSLEKEAESHKARTNKQQESESPEFE